MPGTLERLDVAMARRIGYNDAMASSQGFHEEVSSLQPATRERHRAIVSLQEELEAIDWYDQRIDATGDGELAALLAHNRDEEKEHAAMTLEWLRRHDPALDAMLRRYLFTSGSVLDVEAAADGAGEAPRGGVGSSPSGGAEGDLGVRSRKGGTNL